MKKVIAFYGTIVLKLDDLLEKDLNFLWEEGEKNSTQEFYTPYYEKVLSLQSQIFEILKQNPMSKMYDGMKIFHWSILNRL